MGWERKVCVFNPIALRMAKTPLSFGHYECNRVNESGLLTFGFYGSYNIPQTYTRSLASYSGTGSGSLVAKYIYFYIYMAVVLKIFRISSTHRFFVKIICNICRVGEQVCGSCSSFRIKIVTQEGSSGHHGFLVFTLSLLSVLVAKLFAHWHIAKNLYIIIFCKHPKVICSA